MGKNTKEKHITVFCQKGHKLWRYTKIGGGQLQKCYEDKIGRDYTGQISPDLPLETVIYCSQCNPPVAVAVLTLIHGRRAYQIQHNAVRKTRT